MIDITERFSFGPLITAPMDMVVSSENEDEFLGQGINVCLPRGGKN
jgi:hypothetical protein